MTGDWAIGMLPQQVFTVKKNFVIDEGEEEEEDKGDAEEEEPG